MLVLFHLRLFSLKLKLIKSPNELNQNRFKPLLLYVPLIAMPQNWKELTNAKALKQMLFMVTKRNWKFKLFSFILKAFSVCQSPDIIVVLTFVDYKNKLWHDTFMRRQNFLVKRQRKCQCLYKIRTQKLCSFICKHEISTFSIRSNL